MLLVNELVDALVIGRVTLDDLAIDEIAFELALLVDVGTGEEIDEFVNEEVVLEVKFEVVDTDDDEASLELEVTGVLDGPVMDKDTIELELLRRLKDIELTDVLDMG